VPLAVSAGYGSAALSMADPQRTSPKRHPVVGPSLSRLVRATYFKDAEPSDPLCSLARHPRLAELRPTLILTAEYHTLRQEMNAFADELQAKGVSVTRHQFAGVDHGFTHTKPAETARAAITMIGDLLRNAYSVTTQPPPDTPGGTATGDKCPAPASRQTARPTEIGCFARDVEAKGQAQLGASPAGRHAVLRHTGRYDGPVAANAALQQWAHEGMKPDTTRYLL
jgi:hypothetical protein